MSTTVGTAGRSAGVPGDALEVVDDPVSAESDRAHRPGAYRSFVDGPWGNALAGVVFGLAALGAFWYVHRYAVDVIYFDQWTDISVIQHAHAGTLTPATLWAQHNENRIFFPNLVVLALAYTTHFDVVVEDYLNGILWCGATALIVLAHKRRSPRTPWLYYCPVALVLLSFIPLADMVFGFNLSWCLVMLALAACLSLLDRAAPTRLVYAGAVAAAVVGSYSSLQGLFIWPAGLALLLLRRRSRKVVLAWIGVAVVTVGIYFLGFDVAAAGGSRATASNPLSSLHFFFAVIGNVVGSNIDTQSGAVNAVPLTLGVLIVAVAGWAVVRTIRSDRRGASPLGVALICFGVIFALSITVGRIQFGLATTSRYSIFTLTVWVGAYLALLAPPTGWPAAATASALQRFDRRIGLHRAPDGSDPPAPPDPRGPAPWNQLVTWLARVVLVVLLALQVVLAAGQGLAFGNAWHDQELSVADVESNLTQATQDQVLGVLGAYAPEFILPLARFAQAQRLGVYDSPLYAADRRAGVFPDLLVTIAVPAYGAVLRGTTVIACTAQARVHYDTVEFRVTGHGLHNRVVATGASLFVGWLARWDTTSVPNGNYELSGVIVRPGGSEVVGQPVAIEVRNRPSQP